MLVASLFVNVLVFGVGMFIGNYRQARRARAHVDTGFQFLDVMSKGERSYWLAQEIKVAFDPEPEFVGARRRIISEHDGEKPT
jgi:hypothetical protein